MDTDRNHSPSSPPPPPPSPSPSSSPSSSPVPNPNASPSPTAHFRNRVHVTSKSSVGSMAFYPEGLKYESFNYQALVEEVMQQRSSFVKPDNVQAVIDSKRVQGNEWFVTTNKHSSFSSFFLFSFSSSYYQSVPSLSCSTSFILKHPSMALTSSGESIIFSLCVLFSYVRTDMS